MNCGNCPQQESCRCEPHQCPRERVRLSGCLWEGCLGYLLIAFAIFLLILIVSCTL